MKSTLFVVFTLMLAVGVSAQTKRGQTLGGAAKAAQDERAKKGSATPTSSSSSMPTTPSTSSKGAGDVKDESYWRGRVTPFKQAVRDNSDKAVSMRARISSLTDDLNGIGALNARRAGVETERQRLITQLEELEATIRQDERALKAIEEEGRRAGALPGWFR